MNAALHWRTPDRIGSANLIAQARTWMDSPTVEQDDSPEWTMPLMRRAAAMACSRVRFADSLGHHDARDVAWEGVAIAIAKNPATTWSEAISAGQAMLAAEFNDGLHHHGIVKSPGGGYHQTPAFDIYWLSAPPERPDRGDTHRALRQILDTLDPCHREALMARAVSPTDKEAGILLGLSQAAMSKRIRAARAAFWAQWYAPDSPPVELRVFPPRRILDDTFPCGHDRATNTIWKSRRIGQRRVAECRECNRLSSSMRNATQRRRA